MADWSQPYVDQLLPSEGYFAPPAWEMIEQYELVYHGPFSGYYEPSEENDRKNMELFQHFRRACLGALVRIEEVHGGYSFPRTDDFSLFFEDGEYVHLQGVEAFRRKIQELDELLAGAE